MLVLLLLLLLLVVVVVVVVVMVVTVGRERLVSLAGVIEGFRNWMHSYETNTMYSGHDVAILMTGSVWCCCCCCCWWWWW